MGLALKPEHLKRYKDIARLLIKYGHSDLLPATGLEEALPDLERQAEAVTDPQAEELADDLEEMGPIFIKLGQILSSRADLLPPAYLKALSRLQDRLQPFPFEQAREIVEEDLGARLSKAFSMFDPVPIAAASLGQVHQAALRDGRPVAVKVQRPGIRKQVAEDMGALENIAAFLDKHTEAGERYRFTQVLEEFRENLVRELDYRQEARSMERIGENLAEFDRIVVPQPISDYTTSRVLTMDYVRGKKVTALNPLARMEIDGEALAEQLFRVYLKQILVDGFFHADPHPGNVFVTDDRRIALIDLGMVGHLTPSLQEQLLKMLIAISEGDSEKAAGIAIGIGEIQEDFKEDVFRRRVAAIIAGQQDARSADIQVGRAMLAFSETSADSGIRMPPELTMLGKALLSLDQVARTLAPQFDPNESVRRNVAGIVRQRALKELSPGNALAAAMEARDLVEQMPGRVNRILDMMARSQFKVQVDAFDESTLIEGFQKVANRISLGVVLAALIIGAAMLMRVQTRFELFGYPGLAMICFLLAAGGGFGLILSILINDTRRPHS
ncbi:MAG TPA: AarF/ABC1/UbiB kinase family protein [Chthonomonadaceae bacterium]|nr:AarF/ABC1/UbiB kinase family protein [Chthonomonadaceae bacterium]